MFIIEKRDYPKIIPVFDRYEYDRAVIFSVLTGQFDGTVYADQPVQPNWMLLYTPFGQHFLAGAPNPDTKSELESLLFNTILSRQDEKEIVLFTQDNAWEPELNILFGLRNGVTDMRRHFHFSPIQYHAAARPEIPKCVTLSLSQKKWLPFSHSETWGAEVWVDGESVSSCTAIMVGDHYAEISVDTAELHQNKGYATMAAFTLFDALLKEGITPCWSTWPHRVASQRVARKVGFEPPVDARAWIWFERTDAQ